MLKSEVTSGLHSAFSATVSPSSPISNSMVSIQSEHICRALCKKILSSHDCYKMKITTTYQKCTKCNGNQPFDLWIYTEPQLDDV